MSEWKVETSLIHLGISGVIVKLKHNGETGAITVCTVYIFFLNSPIFTLIQPNGIHTNCVSPEKD